MALDSGGAAWGCGANGYGQLGDGTNTNRGTPVQTIGLASAAAIDGGTHFSAARRSDGTVWTWGSNIYGQLGDGTTTNRNAPVKVLALSRVLAMSAGDFHGLAVVGADTATVTSASPASGRPGDTVALTALLTVESTGEPLGGRTIIFRFDDCVVGEAITDGAGVAGLSAVVPDGATDRTIYARFQGDDAHDPSRGSAPLTVLQAPTSLYVPDRSGTVTEPVILRAYLRRATDNAWVVSRTVVFRIDGTLVAGGVTNGSGRAECEWVVTSGPASRVLSAEFAGDANYLAASGAATFRAATWATKMVAFDRTVRLSGTTELKCRLLRSDNQALYNLPVRFGVDGAFVITRSTDTEGYARYPYYAVPDAGGAGARTILAEWVGNSGYAAVSRTATLTVLAAVPYIWVIPRSVPAGGPANLYAYFRRLSDHKRQPGKVVTFAVDGAPVQTLTTDANGVARYCYWTVEAVGDHTIRCAFVGDPWVEAGYGEGLLRVY